MGVKLDDKAVRAIEEILAKKNEAIVSIRKDGIVVAEQKTKVIFRSSQSRD